MTEPLSATDNDNVDANETNSEEACDSFIRNKRILTLQQPCLPRTRISPFCLDGEARWDLPYFYEATNTLLPPKRETTKSARAHTH